MLSEAASVLMDRYPEIRHSGLLMGERNGDRGRRYK